MLFRIEPHHFGVPDFCWSMRRYPSGTGSTEQSFHYTNTAVSDTDWVMESGWFLTLVPWLGLGLNPNGQHSEWPIARLGTGHVFPQHCHQCMWAMASLVCWGCGSGWCCVFAFVFRFQAVGKNRQVVLASVYYRCSSRMMIACDQWWSMHFSWELNMLEYVWIC